MTCLRLLLLSLITLTGFTACSDDDAPQGPTVRVRLTDSPGDYEKVIVDVVGVQIKTADGEFSDLDETYAASYDLIELTNGKDTLIAASTLPVGEVDQVRLLLGDGNYVHIDGESYRLDTPSAQQSGLKVKVDGPALEPGKAYELVLDFDAGRSVVKAGNSGKYNLKPVLRATLRAVETEQGGRIGGTLQPAEQQWVFAYPAGGDTLGTYADATGAFTLMDVPAGTYTVEVVPSDTAAYGPKIIPGVEVSEGELTDLGTVDLE